LSARSNNPSQALKRDLSGNCFRLDVVVSAHVYETPAPDDKQAPTVTPALSEIAHCASLRAIDASRRSDS
jgi:hypothetical protein